MGVPVRKVDKPVLQVEPAEREGYLFYRRKPWADFPWFSRTVIRLLYKFYGWNTDNGSLENQAFYTTFKTEEEAQAFARERGWGVQGLPINKPLPDETCQYGLNDMPRSKAKWVTTERNLSVVAVDRSRLVELDRGAQSIVDELKI